MNESLEANATWGYFELNIAKSLISNNGCLEYFNDNIPEMAFDVDLNNLKKIGIKSLLI